MLGLAGLLALAVLVAPVAQGATADAEAGALAAAEKSGGASFSTGPDGETVIAFPSRPRGARQAFSAAAGVADVGVASGALVGNYKAAGIQGLTFKIATDGQLPLNAILVIKSGDGLSWLNPNVQVSDVGGAWVLNNVGLARSAGWDVAVPASMDKDALWDSALRNVKAIGIRLAAKGESAQSYSIDDFMLVGAGGFTIPGELTPLQQALMARFGVASIGAVGSAGAADSDGDGMTDLEETLMGTDYFIAEVVEADEAGVTVKWSSAAEWVTYKVMRAPAMTADFAPVADLTTASPEVTVGEGAMVWIDTSVTAADGPFFYKVVGDVVQE